ncbi:MAG: hypothetical protein AB1641_17645 [Thermodesulfobacteriota bacterium]
MKSLRARLQRIFTAMAFAEAGEHETALHLMGERFMPRESLSPVDNVMAAITFAEAGCPDLAGEFLTSPAAVRRTAGKEQAVVSLSDFIEAVGLRGVRIKFGLAAALGPVIQRTTLAGFAEEVGLDGVKFRFGLANA